MGETGVILLAGMLEQRIETKENLTRTLKDVVYIDYFATQKLIREIFISGFDTKQYDDEIKQGYAWLDKTKDKMVALGGSGIPGFVKKNKITLGFYVELVEEIGRSKILSKEPVAFGLSSKALREDIEDIKNSHCGRTRASALTDPDLLSFVVFTKYWQVLNSRARILKK